MNDETKAQLKRVRAIAEAWTRNYDAGIPTGSGLDTRCLIADLLSLLDSKPETGVTVSVLTGYEAGRKDAEIEMRDKCVEKLRELAEDHDDAWARQTLKDAAREVKALTLDQVQEKQQS